MGRVQGNAWEGEEAGVQGATLTASRQKARGGLGGQEELPGQLACTSVFLACWFSLEVEHLRLEPLEPGPGFKS